MEYLFTYQRRKPNAPVVVCALFLLLWGPIGLILALVRAIILIGSLAVLLTAPHCISQNSRPYVRFVLFPLMGWLSWVTNRHHVTKTPNPKVIAMNHASNFDPIWTHVFLCKTSAIVHEVYDYFFNPCGRAGLLGRRVFTARFDTGAGQQRVQREIAEATADGATQPLLVYPEGVVNPSMVGLFRFEKHCFSLGRPVVPVAMRCVNPWPFEYVVNNTSVYYNIFWLLFLPFVIWSFDVGSPMTIEPGQDAIAFSKQVQRWVADRLRIAVTPYNWLDKEVFLMAMKWLDVDPRSLSKAKTTLAAEQLKIYERMRIVRTAPAGQEQRFRRTRELLCNHVESLKPAGLDGFVDLQRVPSHAKAKADKYAAGDAGPSGGTALHGDGAALAEAQQELEALRRALLVTQFEKQDLVRQLEIERLRSELVAIRNEKDELARKLLEAVTPAGAAAAIQDGTWKYSDVRNRLPNSGPNNSNQARSNAPDGQTATQGATDPADRVTIRVE
jgi:hypothetical protein